MSIKKCSICKYELSDEENRIKFKHKEEDIIICKMCIEVAYEEFKALEEEQKDFQSRILDLVNSEDNDFFKSKLKREMEKELENIYPQKLKEKLDDYIIGQEETKKILSVAVFQHIQRMKALDKKISAEEEEQLLKKSNILLIGDSGSGKTLFAETISKILKVPLVIADASSLTSKGYVGGDVDDMLQSLIIKSEGDIKKAERGIIFIDEIDKISSNRESGNKKSKDATGSGVQENLLKIIEGAEVQIKIPPQNPMTGPQIININTKNILFIFGGAFSGIEEVKEELDKKKSKMGFSTKTEQEVEVENELIDYILEYGFSPEFLGRIPVISQLKKLTKKELLEIITKPKNSILKQYETFFKNINSTIDFKEEAMEEIIEEIQNNKIGARALKKIFEKIFLDIIYNIETFENKQITITKEYIKTNKIEDLRVINNKQNEISIEEEANSVF